MTRLSILCRRRPRPGFMLWGLFLAILLCASLLAAPASARRHGRFPDPSPIPASPMPAGTADRVFADYDNDGYMDVAVIGAESVLMAGGLNA